jgi:hypothetical protein
VQIDRVISCSEVKSSHGFIVDFEKYPKEGDSRFLPITGNPPHVVITRKTTISLSRMFSVCLSCV